MREAALMAAVMPGFGNPLDVPIDDFMRAMEHARYVSAVAGGRPMTMTEAVQLDS